MHASERPIGRLEAENLVVPDPDYDGRSFARSLPRHGERTPRFA